MKSFTLSAHTYGDVIYTMSEGGQLRAWRVGPDGLLTKTTDDPVPAPPLSSAAEPESDRGYTVADAARDAAQRRQEAREAEASTWATDGLPGPVRGLLATLAADRAAERAVDETDLDVAPPPAVLDDPPADNGHAIPGHQCGHLTASGPCFLKAGHPTGEDWPGEDGHLGGDFHDRV